MDLTFRAALELPFWLTHWCRVTHICVGKQTIIGSDNGLSPGRRQAIIWTNAGTLLIGPSGTNFSEISIKILTFSFAKMRLKVSSAKWRPFCLSLNVLTNFQTCAMSRDHLQDWWEIEILFDTLKMLYFYIHACISLILHYLYVPPSTMTKTSQCL